MIGSIRRPLGSLRELLRDRDAGGVKVHIALGDAVLGTGAIGSVATAATSLGGTSGGTGAPAATGSGSQPTSQPTSPSSGGNQHPPNKYGAAQLLKDASLAATGVSALYTLAQSRKGLSVPPPPGTVQTDQQIQLTQQQTLQREQAAGGLQSTTATAGGEQGATLNPATTSNKSILGGWDEKRR